MIHDNSIVLDLEFSTHVEEGEGSFLEILQIGAVRIISDTIVDFFNAIVLPSLDHVKNDSRREQFVQMLESDYVIRGTLEEVLEEYLKWTGPEANDTYIWGGGDFHELVKNAKAYCSPELLPRLAPHLKKFIDIEQSYRRWCRAQTFRLKNMMPLYHLEFLGTPHIAIDDAINTARLLLCIDKEFQGYILMSHLDSSVLSDGIWETAKEENPMKPTFASYAKKVLEQKFFYGFISEDNRIVMDRFIMTAPFSKRFLRSLTKNDVKDYLERISQYPPAVMHLPMIVKMLSDVVEWAHRDGFIEFSLERPGRRKEKRMNGRKLWDCSERLFDHDWTVPKDKYICEIAFFTGMNFDSIVKMRGSDVRTELRKYGFPWTDGVKVQSDSLSEFLSNVEEDEWLFSRDGENFPTRSCVETTLYHECQRLGVHGYPKFRRFLDCHQQTKTLNALESQGMDMLALQPIYQGTFLDGLREPHLM